MRHLAPSEALGAPHTRLQIVCFGARHKLASLSDPDPRLIFAVTFSALLLSLFFVPGPRDDEYAGKKFSFVRYTSICAVIPDSEDFEAAAREAGKMQAEIDKAAGSGGGLVF